MKCLWTVLLLGLLVGTPAWADDVAEGLAASEQGDFATAVAKFRSACEGGHARGCNALGVSYRDAEGVRQNLRQAALLFEKSCNGGEKRGCNNLGFAYENGQGVKPDEKKRWHFIVRLVGWVKYVHAIIWGWRTGMAAAVCP